MELDLTDKKMEEISVESAFDATGSLRIGYKGLTAEDFESLKALASSPHWAVYKKILARAQGEFYRASTMVNDVNGVVKMISNSGMSAGINFALMQLQVLCAGYDAEMKKTIEKAKEKPQPFRKG